MEGFRSVSTLKFGKQDQMAIDFYVMKNLPDTAPRGFKMFGIQITGVNGIGKFAIDRLSLERFVYGMLMISGRTELMQASYDGSASVANAGSDFMVPGVFEINDVSANGDIFFVRSQLEQKIGDQIKINDGIDVYVEAPNMARTQIARIPQLYAGIIISVFNPLCPSQPTI